ncbi:MAG: hypothetical protein IPM37_12465 [Hahellaceae bacterium]|nr:hypothetical protein [Hahellaceae bacterium]
MPRQPLHANRIRLRQPRTIWARLSLHLVRLIVLGASLGLSAAGIYEMWSLMQGGGGLVVLQWVFLVLFGINFTWISLSGIQSLVGFLRRMILDLRSGKTDPTVLSGRIAVLMPVYNEDPTTLPHRLKPWQRVWRDFRRVILICSFSATRPARMPGFWKRRCFMRSQKMSPDCPIYYRHRAQNVERKAGNIADWVQRWGGAYASMIVLDADSVMDAEVMLTARRLGSSAGRGLIQTLPTIVNARSVYGAAPTVCQRLLRPYLRKWSGGLRTVFPVISGVQCHYPRAGFADSAKLPILSGKPPFAAVFSAMTLLKQACCAGRVGGASDTDLQASYEEAPPALSDVLVRD